MIRDDRLEKLASSPGWRWLWDRLLQPVEDDETAGQRGGRQPAREWKEKEISR